MKISLVTGEAGFIGTHVTNELIKLGHKVVVLDDLSGEYKENVNPNAIFIEGSVTDNKIVRTLLNTYIFKFIIINFFIVWFVYKPIIIRI